jgi:AcrR family transcriptional regulator
MARKAKYDNLRDACIAEAMKIIETSGIESLSMREVARRLGVSHQAPYKHFENRDHILAEILKRSFEDFARHLDARPKSNDPSANLATMGHAYLQYASENPLQYRLMFATPLPDPKKHPEMMEKAHHAFSLLQDNIAEMNLPSDADMDALYIWSTMHGLASILNLQMFEDLSVSHRNIEQMIQHVIMRISSGLGTK